MYLGLKHAHSGLRWIVLLLLIFVVVQAYRKWKGGDAFGEGDRKAALYALIAVHTQLILGLVLYFTSPVVNFVSGFMKDSTLRFYAIEHLSLMLIAIALITVGFSRMKKKTADEAKFKTLFTFYLIGLILILISIPWPFRIPGAGWF